MARCSDILDKARNQVIAAASIFGGVAIAVGVAIALNNGLFLAAGAPIPMGIAAGLAAACGVLLTSAMLTLNEWATNGCLSRTCTGHLGNIRNALNAAIASVSLVAGSCAAIALIAWIPFFAQVPMWAVYVAAGFTAASLVALAALWTPLKTCEERVAAARGPLMAGEKPSDPWFLRLKPADPPDWAKPINAVGGTGPVLNNQWVECRSYDVREWEVGAIAHILGTPALPVSFAWAFAGKAPAGASIVNSGTSSTLKLASPSLGLPVLLSVTATDKTGYKRTAQTEVTLYNQVQKCHLVLHFVPRELPTEAPGPIEILFEIQRLLAVSPAAQPNQAIPEFNR